MRSSCSPIVIRALYSLSEKDPTFFVEALHSGKTKVTCGTSSSE